MTLASVCLGLLMVYPGLGVIVCVLLVPVLVRTVRVVQHRKAIGVPVSKAGASGSFFCVVWHSLKLGDGDWHRNLC